ncbi:MAG: J domain-containing protein [Victivallales bacterium]|nr:J domain-containing protein [Victivallales bacterium]
MTVNYYEILGVAEDCDFRGLKKAYYRRAKECHPDRHHNSVAKEEEFKLVAEAFNILSDPDKRRRYDGSETNTAATEVAAAAMEEDPGANDAVMDFPGDDDLEELITGNDVPRDTTLSRLFRDLAMTEVFITFREGKNLYRQGRFRAARICFLQAVAHSPDNILYHAFLARSCAGINDFSGALREYGLALSLGARRVPMQEMRRLRRELERLKSQRSPWWYRAFRTFFPAPTEDNIDTRQGMIDATNRAIAGLSREYRRRRSAAKNKERKRLNK